MTTISVSGGAFAVGQGQGTVRGVVACQITAFSCVRSRRYVVSMVC